MNVFPQTDRFTGRKRMSAVVSDVIKGSADFVREVADETKPEKREDADHSST